MFSMNYQISEYEVGRNGTSGVFDTQGSSHITCTLADFDYGRKHIYWYTDYPGRSNVLRGVSIKGTERPHRSEYSDFAQTLGRSYGFSLDWVHNHLYWTEYSGGQVQILDIDSRMQKVLIDGLEFPYGLTVDPRDGQG